MPFVYDIINGILNFVLTTFNTWFYPSLLLTLESPAQMSLNGRIVVYSIVGCPHCMRAKNTLQEHGLPYTDISLDAFPQEREFVKTRTGKSTVPQIFFNSFHMGGNDDLEKLIKNKSEFDKLVDDVRNNVPPADAPNIPDPSTAVKGSTALDFTCEPDEYALLVQDLKASGIIKDHRKGLRTIKNSFRGKDFVNWVTKTKGLDSEGAIQMGQHLIDQHFGHHVSQDNEFRDDDTFFRLVEDDESTALNSGTTSACEIKPVGQLGEDIRRLILKLYSAFLSPDGKRVNYTGIAGSGEFPLYVDLTHQLIRLQVASSSREEKLAFFINIYNALVIHANIVRGPPANLWQRYKFFNTVRYIIGGHEYSLQDIENGVLRANRKGVGMFRVPFPKGDPRLAVALEKHEPLIHFALVCGAKSCPPIKTYSANGIDEQLRMAAEAFLEGEENCQVDVQRKHVILSKIFSWYKVDFGSNNIELLQFIYDHMAAGEKKECLAGLLREGQVKVTYFAYDWGLNSK